MTDGPDDAGRGTRRRRTGILGILTLLLLGAVVSWGVAVLAALSGSKETATLHLAATDAEDLRWWNESTPVGRDLEWTLVDPRRRRFEPGLETTTLEARAISRETGQPDVARVERIRAGWPSPCLEGDTWFLMRATSPPSSPEIVDAGLVPIEFERGVRFIPTRPIMGGLILDSVVMAAILGGIGRTPAGVRWIRGVLRRRSGRCPACGYPGPAVRCPECGGRTHGKPGQC